MDIIRLKLNKFIKIAKSSQGSIQVNSQDVIEKNISNPDFPFLISFPRTGSHWLRMVMELYFEKPSLVRIFYYYNAKEFTCYHRHDENLNIQRKNIIYLYRNPVDTIFSQLKYYRENIDDIKRIRYWAGLYGKHLNKWVLEDNFTTKKTIITYEGMKNNIFDEFRKVCKHFSVQYNYPKLEKAVKQVSKAEVKRKTSHDQQAINISMSYQKKRDHFNAEYSEAIMNTLYMQNRKLKNLFEN